MLKPLHSKEGKHKINSHKVLFLLVVAGKTKTRKKKQTSKNS